MNLEFTSDEEDVITQANRVFEGLSALTRLRAEEPLPTWRRLVEAGWADLGAGIEEGALSLGVAGGVFRAAGRHLLVEQLVTSGFLLSALVHHTTGADREVFTERLGQTPGVLG